MEMVCHQHGISHYSCMRVGVSALPKCACSADNSNRVNGSTSVCVCGGIFHKKGEELTDSGLDYRYFLHEEMCAEAY